MSINLLADDYQSDRCKGIAAVMLKMFPPLLHNEVLSNPYTYIEQRIDSYPAEVKRVFLEVLELPFSVDRFSDLAIDYKIFLIERFKLRLKQAVSIKAELDQQKENAFFGVAA